MAVMSVSSKDWESIASLAASDQRILPCYGVHPWQAHAHASGSSGGGATVASVLRREPREGSDDITSTDLIHVSPPILHASLYNRRVQSRAWISGRWLRSCRSRSCEW